ncbi:MAG: mechanosensitive ion channel family protein [Proteobacteria bacterium]|nr:mechanosensitive ion channel family protein [Pseudomonadota bacterium]
MNSLSSFFQVRPEIIMGVLSNILTILFLLALSYFFLKGLKKISGVIEAGHYISAPFVRFFHSAFKWLVLAGTLLLILQQVGVKLNYLWTILSAAAAMVAIGFVAVWSVLSNFLCTLMLIVFHPFRIGDDIEVIDPAMTSGISGNVRNINLMFTSLYSLDPSSDTPVVTRIPNNLFFQKILRMKTGDNTFGLDKQLFEKTSLLNTTDRNGKDPITKTQ